jgi:hypothetical protein
VTDPTTSASPFAKRGAAALAFAAALALAWASFSGDWMVARRADGPQYFGLRATRMCVRGVEGMSEEACIGQSNLEFVEDSARAGGERATAAFAYAGWACSVALWIAIAGLVVAAGLMLAGRFVARPIAPTTLALLGLAAGLISGVFFVALKPSPELGPNVACYGFAFGELAGIVATILVARIRPRDPEWDDPKPFDEDNW